MTSLSQDAIKPPLRIAFAGDSITWGEGFLTDGFVGEADRYVRERAAHTLFHDELVFQGDTRVIRNRKCYRGQCRLLAGTGAEVSFKWPHNRLVLILAKERHNDRAAMIDLYVNGEKIDTFSTYNESPAGSGKVVHTTDGVQDKYDLGCAFTYEHQVLLEGAPLKGELNLAGYAGAIPEGHDYKIVRKSVMDADSGKWEVRHFIWMREVPASGLRLEASFRHGESVTYARTTIGELSAGLDSALESSYGEGDVAHDPAHPAPISSGLDFRQSDERAMLEWQLPGEGDREIAFRIKGFDPRGGMQGEPGLFVNAVTNSAHHIMNAGIGGWTAKLFNEDRGLRHVKQVAAWRPDIVFVGLGTNDDWGEGNGFVASRTLSGLTEERVRAMPTLLMRSCKRQPDGSYRLETADLLVEQTTDRSVTIDGQDADLSDVRPGDTLVIGDYYGDNRNVLFRLVERWDSASRTAWFDKPLAATPITAERSAFAGQAIRVKRMDGFLSQLRKMVKTLRSELPDVEIALTETGLSNFHTRLLTGYPDAIGRLAKHEGLCHVSVYEELMHWQYGNPCDLPVQLCSDGGQATSGEAVYRLLGEDGGDIQESVGYQLRNWSVKVDGKERYGRGCRIEGGYGLAFRPEASADELLIDNWNGRPRPRHPAVWYRFLPTRLVFTQEAPSPGSRIEVSVSSAKWSYDDAHLQLEGGQAVYNAAIIAELQAWLEKS
ncbi:SGNH/GDSL hydrolase family protein [Paenibacillus sp. J5C_2022]|uniref:SGNH/GDSL hydrolase family protein n=1 Tax=Paenibacillus sp. J5C2022 TaxID=2977129 RepID=UPI0021D18C29|nr:SGNH/GDSL hydrolase family protein [Paenibacillus sp. J5C2022]MCU6708377.1 SGNH/GDSL hydrolase family protein [Paenibacillus sp. J5C2022]